MYMHMVREKIKTNANKKSYDNNLSDAEEYFNERKEEEKDKIFNEINRRDIKSKL